MKTCEVLDLTKNGKVVYSLSLGKECWKFSLERVRVSNEKGIDVNIYCTAVRNDLNGHKIIVMVLPWLN